MTVVDLHLVGHRQAVAGLEEVQIGGTRVVGPTNRRTGTANTRLRGIAQGEDPCCCQRIRISARYRRAVQFHDRAANDGRRQRVATIAIAYCKRATDDSQVLRTGNR